MAEKHQCGFDFFDCLAPRFLRVAETKTHAFHIAPVCGNQLFVFRDGGPQVQHPHLIASGSAVGFYFQPINSC